MERQMTNLVPQFDFDPHSITEIKETLCNILSALEKLLPVAREFCSKNTETRELSPCESCPERDICSEPCVRLQELLPKINSGRGEHENCSEFHDSTLIKIQEEKHLDVFHEYEACEQIFTDKQWIAICLYYRDGKTLQEIAKKLGKAVSTVSDRLKGSRKRKAGYDRRLRAERLEYLHKKNDIDT